MECDQEEPYESVVFRNSQIVFPPELASMTVSSASDDTNSNNESSSSSFNIPDKSDGDNNFKSTKPRHSVLQAFDPVLQRKSIIPSSSTSTKARPRNVDLLVLNQVDFNNPPPLPKRNASFKIHQYDPVTIEDDGRPVIVRKKGQQQPAVNLLPAISAAAAESNSKSSTDEEEEEMPACPSTPKSKTSSAKVRDLINKVSINTDWLNNLKKLSTNPSTPPSPKGTTVDQVDSAQHFKPDISEIGHAGMLGWSASGSRKDPQHLWTELKGGVLNSFSGQNGDTPIHTIQLDRILSVGFSGPEDAYGFDIIINSSREKTSRVSLSAATAKERTKWLEWMLEGLTPFCTDLIKNFSRCGRVFIKDGVGGDWQMAWLLIQSDSKQLWIQRVNSRGQSAVSEDLRKVRSASMMRQCDERGCPSALQPGCPLIVHWSDHTRYIQSDQRAESESWLEIIRSVALHSGADLEDHQLTADDVPVLVECCIKFIETYGMLTEGIYRRSGVQSKINRLLTGLRSDAWSLHISNEEYSEHDVANVLKRFFRTLPEPLLTNELYSQWIAGLSIENRDSQLKLYKRLLAALPRIKRQTLSKLLGHLHAVQNKCEKNLMTANNLAALWGPNLMTVESARDHTSNFSHTNAETDVVLQLIQDYPWLFDVDREKLAVNDQISEVQERLGQGAFAKKSAGDIRTWIFSEPSEQDVAVEIGPRVRVCDVLPGLQSSASDATGILMESICRGELRRPLHSKELLLPAILKWADWDEEHRRDNKLVFGHHPTVDRLCSSEKNLVPKSMFEIHYSSPKSKTFRQCPFEFCQARFTVLKDLKNHTVQGRWDVENVIWYLGGDSRRNPPSRWCVTFIEKDVPIPKKGRFFLGHCLSFATELDYLTLLTSLILTEFEGGIQGFTALAHHPTDIKRD